MHASRFGSAALSKQLCSTVPGSQSAAVQAMPVLPPLACELANAASRSIRTVLRPARAQARATPQPTTPPLELVFTLCWRCTKASPFAPVTEMRNLANKEERNTKVNQLERLAFEILPSERRLC